jgi:hypothetical protein
MGISAEELYLFRFSRLWDENIGACLDGKGMGIHGCGTIFDCH